MDCSTPGFPVHHQLPQLAQTDVHWVDDAIQPSHPVVPFSSCLQSFPASGSFLMSQFFTLGGHSIGVSASASILPTNIHNWFPLRLTGLIFLLSKGLSRVFSSTTIQFSSVQSLSHVYSLWLHGLQPTRLPCPSPTSRACSNSTESMMPSNHHFCRPLLLLPSIFPGIRIFSKESVLRIRWAKYWSFSFSISPSNEYSVQSLGLTSLISLQSKGLSRVFSITTVQKHQFFSAQITL